MPLLLSLHARKYNAHKHNNYSPRALTRELSVCSQNFQDMKLFCNLFLEQDSRCELQTVSTMKTVQRWKGTKEATEREKIEKKRNVACKQDEFNE